MGGVYALRTTDEGPTSRVVFLDSAGLVKPSPVELEPARSLGGRGYRVLGRDSLVAFLSAREADGKPSVVVFAMDYLPADLLTAPLDRSVLRRYLARGGKAVWGSVPPHIYSRDPRTGQRGAPG